MSRQCRGSVEAVSRQCRLTLVSMVSRCVDPCRPVSDMNLDDATLLGLSDSLKP